MDSTPTRALLVVATVVLASTAEARRAPTINLTIKDADVRSVVTFIAQEVGLSVVFSPAVSGRVTMSLTRVPVRAALRAVLKSQGLDLVREGNVIVVMTQEERLAQLEAEARRYDLVPPPPKILVRQLSRSR